MSTGPTKLRIVVRTLVMLMFLFLLGLSLWLLAWARQNYAEKLMAQTWPSGTATPGIVPPDKASAPLLVLLGDSRVVDWGLPELEGFRVANWAANGSSSAQGVARCREMLASAKPHTVVLQIGINDLKLLGLKPELRDAVITAVASNTLAIVRDCRRAGARVIVLPVWPTGRVDFRRRLVWSETIEPARVTLNTQVQTQAAALEDVCVFDLFKTLAPSASGAADADWFRDTLHLKPAAYTLLTKRLLEELASRGWLPQAASSPQPR